MTTLLRFGVLALTALLVASCTTTNPYTGETEIDSQATGALVGLAVLGAAAYAASSDDDDDRHEHHRHHRNHRHTSDYSSYSPRSNITCYLYKRACYKSNGHYSAKWTRREFN